MSGWSTTPLRKTSPGCKPDRLTILNENSSICVRSLQVVMPRCIYTNANFRIQMLPNPKKTNKKNNNYTLALNFLRPSFQSFKSKMLFNYFFIRKSSAPYFFSKKIDDFRVLSHFWIPQFFFEKDTFCRSKSHTSPQHFPFKSLPGRIEKRLIRILHQ